MPDATGFDGSTFLEVKGEITTGYNAGPFEPTINGVRITQKPQITDERGSVMHMLRADAPEFMEFGEIYFSTVNPGKFQKPSLAFQGWGRVLFHGSSLTISEGSWASVVQLATIAVMPPTHSKPIQTPDGKEK